MSAINSMLLALWMASASVDTGRPASLDFLKGAWQLFDATGQPVGTSCVWIENGFVSEVRRDRDGDLPVWFYQSESNSGWTQLFPGPSGALREFLPLSKPGVWPMVLGNQFTLKDGRKADFRLTLKTLAGRNSRRTLEMSTDGKASWSTVFDFEYRSIHETGSSGCNQKH